MFDLLIFYASISSKKSLEIKDNNNIINVLY